MRVLLHVEDPGAANWVAPLAAALGGHETRLLAEGAARGYLADRGVAHEERTAGTAATLLARHAPDVVVAGTSENLDGFGLSLIDAARARGVPSASPVDQAANAEHRFRGRGGDPGAHAPDLLFLPDEAAASAFRALGFPEPALAVTGNPHHARLATALEALGGEDDTALRQRVAPGAGDRPLVVFLAEIGYVVNPEAARWESELLFEGRDGTAPRARRMLEELVDALPVLPERPFLVLRLHPKNTEAEFAALATEVDLVSRGGDPLPLVLAADLVVGLSGSLLEEAHLMGRRCLSILPHGIERGWLPSLASGATPAATNRAELRRLLPAVLAAPPPPRAALCSDAAARMVQALEALVAARPRARRSA